MNSFPLRQLILPAVLVASGVFSVLTMPLVLYKPNSAPVNLPFFEGDLRPVFAAGNRNLAIRYVGGAIVTSVAAGLGTVELMRRSHNKRQATLEALLAQPEEGSDLPALELADPPAVFESVDDYFNAAIATEPAPSSESDQSDIFAPADRYQTCRIQVPQTERRFFAILINGEYYRLFRARKTSEQAIAMAERLRQRGDRVVITQMPQGHALWVWEPQAYLSMG